VVPCHQLVDLIDRTQERLNVGVIGLDVAPGVILTGFSERDLDSFLDGPEQCYFIVDGVQLRIVSAKFSSFL
jgi:hypothetical protein